MITPIRFFFDENLLGVGKALAEIRYDVTYIGDLGNPRRNREPCSIITGTEDQEWLPIAGSEGWTVITRDKHIRTRPGELLAVNEHSVKLFAVTSKRDLNQWDTLRLLVGRWNAIEQRMKLPGPFVCAVTDHAIQRLKLP